MSGFSNEQIAQIRQVFREEFVGAGVRLDGPDHQEQAREDFRFLRRMRQATNGFASKVGWVVIMALLAGVISLFNLGLNAWRSQGGI